MSKTTHNHLSSSPNTSNPSTTVYFTIFFAFYN
uniref:Uncharacterized protein n=1 Tax=Rhizophora mucronata TaxID=61149 RepID=A0A2P2QRU4_RHIMU